MKTSTRFLAFLLILVMTVLFCVSCGGEDVPANAVETGGENGDVTNNYVETFTVTFANTSLESKTVEKGKTVSQPADPTKTGCIFGGWFSDKDFTTEAKFPITVNSDVTVYAKFVEEFTVTFANTSLESKTVEKGKTVSQPADPTKTGCIFGGWFTDKNFTTEAKFPITVNSDVTVYAKFNDYQTAFKEARENTIGDDVPGFEYSYSLNVDVSYILLSLTGKTNGTAKYSTVGDVNYYDEHTNSGALFYDGSKYQIRRGTTLQKISLDEDGKVKDNSFEEVDNSYKYDSSSFAKAVFTYSDDQLKSITPTSQKDVYKLNTALNFSSVMALVGNNINNKIIEDLIGELPETSVDTGMYVTFSNGKIDSYRYEMTIDVSGLQLNLIYTLEFTDVGNAKNITPKEIIGLD